MLSFHLTGNLNRRPRIEMTRTISVLLAEDHATVRGAVKLLLESESDITVVGEAGNGADAVSLAKSLKPELVLMDIGMPGLDGARATRRIKSALPDTKVLVLTRHDDDGYVKKLLAERADGYVLKQSASDVLIHALRQVSAGNNFLDPSLVKGVLNEVFAGSDIASEGSLTQREIAVLQYTARGFSVKEITADTELGQKTVENIKSSINRKLGFTSRVDLVRYAIKQGWMNDS
jgi:two-component system, NarL family, response regulator NreC